MTKHNYNKPNFKSSSNTAGDIDPRLLNTPITQHFASGTVDNDKLPLCRICASNGFPHEPLRFEKVNGRIRSDGTNEVKEWVLRNYFTGHNHVHRSVNAAEEND
jgi:hypothetical protein